MGSRGKRVCPGDKDEGEERESVDLLLLTKHGGHNFVTPTYLSRGLFLRILGLGEELP